MTSKSRYHGGLVFLGNDDGTLERFSQIVAATLQDYGHLVERRTVLSETEASVVSSQYLVQLSLETEALAPENRDDGNNSAGGFRAIARKPVLRGKKRLVITMSPVSELLDDNEVSELMLVVMLYRMVDICTSLRVEWLSPNTVLTIEQFMSAFDTLTPGRQRGCKQIFASVSGPFSGSESDAHQEGPAADQHTAPAVPTDGTRPIEVTDQVLLTLAFREDEEPEQELSREDRLRRDLQRLSSWGMTGAVAFLCAPVAASMAAVNLIRGEDFRLNTHVLSYTAALVLLQSSGAITEVTAALGL
ncbi:hypothetical protein [Ruegeria marisrubri]|uniref:hypothetical protein n=1 Tax=Ruegeria marisrubri TaxID=1685379 RepID=UPI000AD0905A|nr:hypothetical protein [Ruegeria marisrubri]